LSALDYNGDMNWKLLGHEWAVQLLRKHITDERVRHAYLITGPEAVGKRTLALRFAQALNCEAPPQRGEFCGECRACRLIMRSQHPDLHVVESESETRVLRVDQVRELQRQLVLTPVEGRWRIALLPEFEEAVASSQASAANALLKTLEEPPPHVILLLTASSRDALLPTVVSRCEVISLRTVPHDVLKRDLIHHGASPQKAHFLASTAAGRPGHALALMQDSTIIEERQALLDEFINVLGMNRAERFDYVDRVYRSKDYRQAREDALHALKIWSAMWRDALVVQSQAEVNLQNPDHQSTLDSMSALEAHEMLAGIEAIKETIAAIEQNANTRLAMEAMMLSLPYLKLESHASA
jgi:DNA polymerase-3 subunit delta'